MAPFTAMIPLTLCDQILVVDTPMGHPTEGNPPAIEESH